MKTDNLIKNIHYSAAMYLRLSRDDNAARDADAAPGRDAARAESNSIGSQRELIRAFIHGQQDIELYDIYVDDGFSGSNFDRPEFKRMMEDIKAGRANCVIVKDLSRFGRNYLEAGNYIEKIFPFLGVRFIAVADGYDTGEEGSSNQQMASEIKNLVNDMYAKDFSRKAKVSLKQRREQGSYVGGPPPYGYRAAWDGKRRVLVPDENTASIVQFIFERFVETESAANVADELNRRKVNPPAVYKKTGAVCHDPEIPGYKGWNRNAVERLLGSRTYMGTLVQGKTSITARDEKNRIHKPEDEWVVSENSHEPLVDAGLYRKAQEAREKIRARTAAQDHPTKGCPIGENIFDNVLYCGVCGRKMTRSSYAKHYADGKVARLDGYFCLDGGATKTTTCPESNRISKRELVDILIPLVRTEFAVYLDKPARFMEYGRERIAEAGKKATAAMREAENKIFRLREEESRIYMDYHAGKLPQQEYTAYKEKQEGRLADLEKQKVFLEGKVKELGKFLDRYLAAIKALIRFRSASVLDKEMAEAFFSRISVYPGKRVEVTFTFTPGCMEGVE